MRMGLLNVCGWASLAIGRRQPIDDGQRRYVRIIQAALTSIMGKGFTLLVNTISVPLTLPYLGTERYGLWMIVSSILLWLRIMDLGLGNGLINALSKAYGENRPDVARSNIASAYTLMITISLVLGGILVVVWRWIDWVTIFNISSVQAQSEVSSTLAVVIAMVVLNLPLSLTEKIYRAYQDGYIINTWMAVGNVISLFALFTVVRLRLGVVWLVLATSGTLLLVMLAATIALFVWQKPWLMPRQFEFNREVMKGLIGVGGMFFVLQLAGRVIFDKDNFIIAYYLGPSDVAMYSTVWRLFLYSTFFQSLLFAPLWPAYAEALAGGDMAWLRKTFVRTAVFSMLSTAVIVGMLVIFGQQIVSVWTGSTITVSQPLLVAMAIWTLIGVWMSGISCVLNASGRIALQSLSAILVAVASILLSVTWIHAWGPIAVVSATIVAYLVFAIVPQTVQAFGIIFQRTPSFFPQRSK